MVALKYAIMIDGVTQLIMMKSDVMNDFDTIRVATAYEIGGERTDRFPYAVDAPIVPVYKEFKGWKCDLRKFRRYEDFGRIQGLCGVHRVGNGRARADYFGRPRPR